jgi:hypothetical protein
MDANEARSKEELLNDIEQSWSDLETLLGSFTDVQMTEPRDAEGWNVKDHLVHVASWERSVVAMLQNRPRYEGLGIDEELFRRDDVEAINALIQQQRMNEPLADVLSDLRTTHDELMRLLAPLSDDDLLAINHDDQPEDRGERDERPVIAIVYANTAEHFREHGAWIEALVARAPV